jgi:hypothetical protein
MRVDAGRRLSVTVCARPATTIPVDVRDKDDSPVTGARCILFTTPQERERRGYEAWTRWQSTDLSGRASLTLQVPLPSNFTELRAGMLVVAEGYAAILSAVWIPKQAPELQRIQLSRPGAMLSGRIVDEAGRPLPNVEVELGALFLPGGVTVSLEQTLKSDASGRFRSSSLPPGTRCTISFALDDFDPTNETPSEVGPRPLVHPIVMKRRPR